MLLKKSLTRFLITPLAIAALLLLSGGVLAQTDTGRIAGTITDQNGAVVSNASITVDERIRALERELRQQNRVLAEMRAIIAEQECSIETLSARAAGHCGPPRISPTRSGCWTGSADAPAGERRGDSAHVVNRWPDGPCARPPSSRTGW